MKSITEHLESAEDLLRDRGEKLFWPGLWTAIGGVALGIKAGSNNREMVVSLAFDALGWGTAMLGAEARYQKVQAEVLPARAAD